MAELSTEKCPNCDTELKGKFCYTCGQKIIEEKELTLKHFIFQFFGSAFFLENNFLKNIWTLVSKPGRLPLDFIEGRRKRWMPPFSLFLLINLFYFWYTPLVDLNMSLPQQMSQDQHARLAKYLVDKKLKAESITFEEYAARYASKSSTYANSLIVLHIPILALFLYFIFYQNRYYFVYHFIVSLYLLAFIMLAGLVVFRLFELLPNHKEINGIVKAMMFVIVSAYIFAVIHRTYARKWWASLLLTIPVSFAFYFTNFIIYRTLLFLIIYSVT